MSATTVFGFLNTNQALNRGRTTPSVAIPGIDQSLLTSFTSLATTPLPGITTGAGTGTTTAATASPTASLTQSQGDFRLRLAHLTGYGNPYPGIMAPLAGTRGLLFPYTPTISVSQDVDYANMQMTHSNTDYYSFSRSPNTTITITAKFSVQNQTEGKYVTGALMFLKSVSKMNFGQSDANKGLPPPILTLNGYGTYNFNMVRVFLKQHAFSYEENMDLVRVTVGSGYMMLPPLFTVTLSLTAQQTPRAMRQDFTLDAYRDGSLLAKGGYI